MIKLIKNLDCYCPGHAGINDLLICGERIFKIRPNIQHSDLIETIYDCEGMLAFPGFIDQHVHITGGGGEEGFGSHVTEIEINTILNAGITTIVGLLGADSITRSIHSVYAKAKALEQQGITTYIYTGSYRVPFPTLTGDVMRDLVLIDKVIGIGEVAMSDHRSSYMDIQELLKVAADIHMGGLLGGKAGIMHIHMGDGKARFKPLLEIVEKSDLPMSEFIPTHTNRNPELFEQATAYCLSGGNIDLTSGEKAGISVPDAIQRLIERKVDLSKVTVSSDANGSCPEGGVNSIATLYEDIISCIKDKGISAETAFSLVTENVAKVLKLYPRKGALMEGSDADILITDKNYNVNRLFSKGELVLDLK